MIRYRNYTKLLEPSSSQIQKDNSFSSPIALKSMLLILCQWVENVMLKQKNKMIIQHMTYIYLKKRNFLINIVRHKFD